MRLQGETRELPVTLTEAELVQAGADLCEAVQDADKYELAMEGRKADWRETLKALKDELAHRRKVASEAAEVVRTGKVRRDVACTWKYALAAGYAFLTRTDTGELVTHRKLKDEERQLSFGEPPFAEPTPEELESWLKTLPINEAEVLPEGHAAEVGEDDRAVDPLDDSPKPWDVDGEDELADDDYPGDYGDDVGIEGAREFYDEEMTDDNDDPVSDTEEETFLEDFDADDASYNAAPPLVEMSDEDFAKRHGAKRAPDFNPNPGISELAAMSDEDVAKLGPGAKR